MPPVQPPTTQDLCQKWQKTTGPSNSSSLDRQGCRSQDTAETASRLTPPMQPGLSGNNRAVSACEKRITHVATVSSSVHVDSQILARTSTNRFQESRQGQRMNQDHSESEAGRCVELPHASHFNHGENHEVQVRPDSSMKGYGHSPVESSLSQRDPLFGRDAVGLNLALSAMPQQDDHPPARSATPASDKKDKMNRTQQLWDVKEADVALPSEVTNQFKEWKVNPYTFLQMERSQTPTCAVQHYRYVLSVSTNAVHKKILWRFMATVLYDSLNSSGRYSITKESVELAAAVIFGPCSTETDEVRAKILKCFREGARYLALAKELGSIGCLFYLPQSIDESLWVKHLPLDKHNIAAERLKQCGIFDKAYESGAVELAKSIETIFKAPFQSIVPAQLKGEYTFPLNSAEGAAPLEHTSKLQKRKLQTQAPPRKRQRSETGAADCHSSADEIEVTQSPEVSQHPTSSTTGVSGAAAMNKIHTIFGHRVGNAVENAPVRLHEQVNTTMTPSWECGTSPEIDEPQVFTCTELHLPNTVEEGSLRFISRWPIPGSADMMYTYSWAPCDALQFLPLDRLGRTIKPMYSDSNYDYYAGCLEQQDMLSAPFAPFIEAIHRSEQWQKRQQHSEEMTTNPLLTIGLNRGNTQTCILQAVVGRPLP